jgi:hypothetical protein
MKGVRTVIFFSHKMAHSPPSHHHVESCTIELYGKIQSRIPMGVGIYEVAGHNHIMAKVRMVTGLFQEQEENHIIKALLQIQIGLL